MNLFEYADKHYPKNPGWKKPGTSSIAARRVSNQAAIHRAMVERWFREGNTGCPEECAAKIGVNKLSVRSRISELAGDGILEETGERVPSPDTGFSVTVWRLKL